MNITYTNEMKKLSELRNKTDYLISQYKLEMVENMVNNEIEIYNRKGLIAILTFNPTPKITVVKKHKFINELLNLGYYQ